MLAEKGEAGRLHESLFCAVVTSWRVLGLFPGCLPVRELRPPFTALRSEADILVDLTGVAAERDAVQETGGLAELKSELRDRLEEAVDRFHVAAILESEGINDRVAHRRFGFRDVFALAEALYLDVPIQVHREITAKRESSWIALTTILRGLLYALPGVLYFAAGGILATTSTLYVIAPALVFAWAWNQAIAYLSYTLMGRREVERARLFARWAVAGGTGLTAVGSVGVSLALTGEIWPAAIAVAQTVYLLSSATLLLFRRDDRLAISLIPGMLIAVPFIAGMSIPGVVVMIGLAVTVVLVAFSAWEVTDHERPDGGVGLHRRDYLASVPYLMLGYFWATLLAVSTLAVSSEGQVSARVGLAIVPLVLSMGFAEWLTYGYLRQSKRILSATYDTSEFALAVWRLFQKSFLLYAGVLVSLSLIVWVIGVTQGAVAIKDILMLAAYESIGGAFFVGLILVALGQVDVVLAQSAMATTIAILGLAGAVPGAPGPVVVYLVACFSLSLGLLVAARRLLKRAVIYA